MGMAALLRGTSYHASRCGLCACCWLRSSLTCSSDGHISSRACGNRCICLSLPASFLMSNCRNRTYLPTDLCNEHGIQPADVFSGSVSEKLREVVFRVAACAKVSVMCRQVCHKHVLETECLQWHSTHAQLADISMRYRGTWMMRGRWHQMYRGRRGRCCCPPWALGCIWMPWSVQSLIPLGRTWRRVASHRCGISWSSRVGCSGAASERD